jgi:hypothetical protein
MLNREEKSKSKMTKLEVVAQAMFESIEWGNLSDWALAPDLRKHYLVLAAVGLKALRSTYDPSQDHTAIEMIDAILNENLLTTTGGNTE